MDVYPMQQPVMQLLLALFLKLDKFVLIQNRIDTGSLV